MPYLVTRDPNVSGDLAAGFHVTVWHVDADTDRISAEPALRIAVEDVEGLAADIRAEAAAIRQLGQLPASHQSNAARS